MFNGVARPEFTWPDEFVFAAHRKQGVCTFS
jgi:hypothetical protein